jgi:hypothetical protein
MSIAEIAKQIVFLTLPAIVFSFGIGC